MTAGQWLLDFFWNNAELHVDVNKVVGVVIALIGTALAAPKATAQQATLAAKIALRPLQLLGSALRRLGRLLGMKPRQTIQTFDIADHVGISDAVAAETTHGDWPPETTFEDKIDWLRDAYRKLEVGLREAKKNSSEEHQRIRDELEAKATEVHEDIEGLESFILREKARSVQVQAIGLGPITVGIILSGIPEIIASWSIVGWLVLMAAIAITIAALRESVSEVGSSP